MKRLFLLFALLLMEFGCFAQNNPNPSPHSHEATGDETKISIFAELPPNVKPRTFLEASLAALEDRLSSQSIEVFIYERHELLRAVALYAPQFIIADSDLAVVLERYKGYKPLLSFKSSVTEDVNAMGATLIAVKKDSAVSRIEQLNGNRIGRLAQANVAGWKSALGEVSLLGYEPSEFFRRIETFRSPELLAQAIVDGKVTAGLFPGCIFESLPAEVREKLKAVEPRLHSSLHCLSTTMLYPAWTILSSKNVENAVKDEAEQILLNLRTTDIGAEWRPPANLRDVYAMMRRSHDELITNMEKTTLADQVWKYRYALAGIFLVLLALIFNNRYLKRAVSIKEKELTQVTGRRLAAEEKLVKWEKASMASILSSIVSHELKQPLSIIENYAVGISKKSERLTNPSDKESLLFACGKILAQTHRAIQLIDYVRSYSKNPQSKKEHVFLDKVVKAQAESIRSSLNPKIHLEVSVSQNFEVYMDPFELEICIHNLVKNAKEALEKEKKGTISVSITPYMSKGFLLTVEDTGPLIPAEVLKKLKTPGKSEKSEGLGLGLAIVRGVAEKYHGSFELENCSEKGRGTRAVVSFLAMQKDERN